jgi:hypothetical protein
MTVEQLIKKLREYDQTMRVLVDGYESGYDNPRFKVVNSITDVQKRDIGKPTWFRGRYDQFDGGRIKALVIGRP